MKPVNKNLFEAVKLSLRLSEKGEVCRMHRLSIVQVKLINQATSYEEYEGRIQKINDDIKNESVMVAQGMRMNINKLDQILKDLEEIKNLIRLKL